MLFRLKTTFTLAFVSVVLMIPVYNTFGQSTESLSGVSDQEDSKDVGSIFQVPILNSLAWQSGEYLVSARTTLDSVGLKGETGGFVVDQHVLTRAAFDYKKMKYGSCSFIRAKVKDFNQFEDGEPKTYVFEYRQIGFADFTSGEVFLNDSQLGYREATRYDNAKKRSFSEIPELGYVDYRSCWTAGSRTEQNFSRVRNDASVLRNSEFKYSVENGKLKIKIRGRSNLEPKIRGPFENFTFDVVSSMPERFSSYSVHTASSKKIMEQSVSVKWVELNDVFLPTKLVKNALFFGIGPVQSLRLPGQEVSKLHWFDINNEKSQPKLFEPDNVKNLESVLDLVDPVKNEAMELIGADEKW